MNEIHWKLERPTVHFGSDLAGPLRWLALAARNQKMGRVRFMALRMVGGGAGRQSGGGDGPRSGARETPSSGNPILCTGEERLSP
jgi:hypothetical protein